MQSFSEKRKSFASERKLSRGAQGCVREHKNIEISFFFSHLTFKKNKHYHVPLGAL